MLQAYKKVDLGMLTERDRVQKEDFSMWKIATVYF